MPKIPGMGRVGKAFGAVGKKAGAAKTAFGQNKQVQAAGGFVKNKTNAVKTTYQNKAPQKMQKAMGGAMGATSSFAKAAKQRAAGSVGKVGAAYKNAVSKQPRPAPAPGTLNRGAGRLSSAPNRSDRLRKVEKIKKIRAFKAGVKKNAPKIAGGAAVAGGVGGGAYAMNKRRNNNRSYAQQIDKSRFVLTGQGKNRRWRKRDATVIAASAGASMIGGIHVGKKVGQKVVGARWRGKADRDAVRMVTGKKVVWPLETQGRYRNNQRIRQGIKNEINIERISREIGDLNTKRKTSSSIAHKKKLVNQIEELGRKNRALTRTTQRYAKTSVKFTRRGARAGAAAGLIAGAAAGAGMVYLNNKRKGERSFAEAPADKPKWKKKSSEKIASGVAGAMAGLGVGAGRTSIGYAASRELSRKKQPGEKVSKRRVAGGIAAGAAGGYAGSVAGRIAGSATGAALKAATKGKVNAGGALSTIGGRVGTGAGVVKGYESVSKYRKKKTGQ